VDFVLRVLRLFHFDFTLFWQRPCPPLPRDRRAADPALEKSADPALDLRPQAGRWQRGAQLFLCFFKLSDIGFGKDLVQSRRPCCKLDGVFPCARILLSRPAYRCADSSL